MRRDRERECTGQGQMEGLDTELHTFAFRLRSITHVNMGGWRDAVRTVYAWSGVSNNFRHNALKAT